MDHLGGYRVGEHPVHYIPDFVSESEEMEKFVRSPVSSGTVYDAFADSEEDNLVKRYSLQIWGGELTKSGTLIPQDLPAFVTSFPDLIEKLRATGAFASTSQGTANHIILNEYLAGQGITPHQDGPAYHPAVATLSLGSHTVMDYYQYQQPSDVSGANDSLEDSGKIIDPSPVLRLLLEPRSLVITRGSLYAEHLHGIAGVKQDLFVPPGHRSLETPLGYTERGNGQIIPSKDIANVPLLGDMDLRDRLEKLGSDDLIDDFVELQRRTRISLTCRVVERTSSAVGKLVKLR